MSSRYSDDCHSRKGSRTSKPAFTRPRSRSRSRSSSSPSSPLSSSSPSPDRHRKYHSKHSHNTSKQASTHLVADKSRSESSCSGSVNSSATENLSNFKHNGNNRNTFDQSSRYQHDSYRDGNDESKGSNSVVCPPPPIISKVSMSFGKKPVGPAKPVQMKLSTAKPSAPTKKLAVAKAFSTNDSSDDEVEEMPAECRMRMRNIGRDTPTSSGPNSFGKTKQGFCDAKKIFEKNLRECSYD